MGRHSDDSMDRISHFNALRATEAGRAAHGAGALPSACPFMPFDDVGRFLAACWGAGWWMEARPGVAGAWAMHWARITRAIGT